MWSRWFAERRHGGDEPIRLQVLEELVRSAPAWSPALTRAANPLVPSLKEALERALDDGERERFVACLRPRVEAGDGVARSAHGYLVAVK